MTGGGKIRNLNIGVMGFGAHLIQTYIGLQRQWFAIKKLNNLVSKFSPAVTGGATGQVPL